ncbi:MAG: Hsp20/alpha crystallin family protein [Anaerolineae bacterium]|nr:Hsp20/alpha crystallin family protein [Anaerolineae bacterium]
MAWNATSRAVWQPPTDVYETSDEIVVRVEVAGVDPRQVEIQLSERVLTVSGVRQDAQEKVGYHRMEILHGPFRTRVVLPRRADAARVQAEYRDGFLLVRVPKASPIRVRVEGVTATSDGPK